MEKKKKGKMEKKKERKKKKSRVYRTAKLVLSKDMSIGNVVEYVRVYMMVEYMFLVQIRREAPYIWDDFVVVVVVHSNLFHVPWEWVHIY